MPGVFILAGLWALSCQAAVATAPSQAVEALSDEVSLLQKNLAFSAEKPSMQQEPLGQGGLFLAQSRGQRTHTIPSVVLNLDLPPEERWYAAFGDELKQYFVNVPEKVDRTLLDDIDWSPFEEQLQEIRGIVKAVNNPKLTLEHLLSNELGYEKGATACSGVLAATSNGTVFHGRNLDLNPSFRVGLEQLVREVTYYRGGQPLFSAITFGVSSGVATGYRIGSYSVAQNTRRGCGDVPLSIESARRGGQPMHLMMRKTLQEVATFEDALHRLAEVPLIAPQYFTVGGAGPWQGALISRDRQGYSAPYPNVEELSPQIGRWFIVQTNDDTWKPAVDDRRPMALAKFSTLTPEAINAETMLDVMTTPPVLNDGTIFTWVLQPSTGLRRVRLGTDELRGDVAVPAFVSEIGGRRLAGDALW